MHILILKRAKNNAVVIIFLLVVLQSYSSNLLLRHKYGEIVSNMSDIEFDNLLLLLSMSSGYFHSILKHSSTH